jgi:hypothetical protein
MQVAGPLRSWCRFATLMLITCGSVAAQPRCRTSADTSAQLVAAVQDWLADSSSPTFLEPLRKRLGLSRTAPSSVVVITDPTSCTNAALNWALPPAVVHDPARTVYLVRAGANRYFVWKPVDAVTSGVVVLDQRFKYLTVLMLL